MNLLDILKSGEIIISSQSLKIAINRIVGIASVAIHDEVEEKCLDSSLNLPL